MTSQDLIDKETLARIYKMQGIITCMTSLLDGSIIDEIEKQEDREND